MRSFSSTCMISDHHLVNFVPLVRSQVNTACLNIHSLITRRGGLVGAGAIPFCSILDLLLLELALHFSCSLQHRAFDRHALGDILVVNMVISCFVLVLYCIALYSSVPSSPFASNHCILFIEAGHAGHAASPAIHSFYPSTCLQGTHVSSLSGWAQTVE